MRMRILSILALLLAAPAFVQAFTLKLQVVGGDASHYVTVGSAKITTGTTTYYPSSTVAPNTYSVSGATDATITLDGNQFTVDQPILPPEATATSRTLKVAFAAAQRYDVSVGTQPTGGYVYVQTVDATGKATSGSTTSLKGLPAATKVKVSVYPNTVYKVTRILCGTTAKSPLTPAAPAAGQVATYTGTASELSGTVTATLVADYKVTAYLYATPSSASPGNTVTLTTNGTTTNDTAIARYDFTVLTGPANPAIEKSTDGKSATLIPTVPGQYRVHVVATSTNGGEATADAVFNVLSAAETSLNYCSSCHASRTPEATAFSGSVHWTSPTNVSATGTCAQKCHFKSTSQPACYTCHSGNLNPDGTFATGAFGHPGPAADVDNTCYVCHSGSKHGWSARAFEKSSHFTGYAAVNYYQMNVTKCLACHNPHTTEATMVDGKTDVCSGCHQYHGPTADLNYGLYSSNGQGRAPHYGGVKSSATSNGAQDNPSKGLAPAQTQFMAQGAICADCHAHNNTINAGYAESGHGKISTDPMNAFVHYDWTTRSAADNGSSQNGNCNRCHTSQGFIKFAQQDADKVARLALQAGQPNGVLLCITCHKALEGENLENAPLRTDAVPSGNQGLALSAGYFATFSSANTAVAAGKTKITIQFPGYKNSSVCIPCHSGRSTDQVFIAVIDQAKANLKNYTTISTSYYQHAANMGQTFLGKGAYDFTGARIPAANSHANVKNGASDTQGPCVGCHYNKAGATHSLEVVNFDVCASCHLAGFGATELAAAEEKFEAGMKVLDALIHEKFDPLMAPDAARGGAVGPLDVERAPVRFGRFGAVDPATGLQGQATDAAAKAAYGAWYNWQILKTYDKAAFAHNPGYARQILFDTIDFLDGTVTYSSSSGKYSFQGLNNSAEATINASTAVTAAEKTAAVEFFQAPCATCHAATTEKVQEGKHAYEVSTHSGSCGRCHTTEGYVAYAATTPDFTTVISTAYNGGSNVSCAACHDSHGNLRDVSSANFNPTVNPGTADASQQFKLCTSCHNLVNNAGVPVASGLVVSGTTTVAKQQHAKDWYRNIASTHYDLTTTGVGQASTVIEGYNVRYNKDSACTDCHGHELYTDTEGSVPPLGAAAGTATVHTEWAQSGHAGKLLKAKFAAYTATGVNKRTRNTTSAAAVMAAGVTGTSGAAWEHYNWDQTTGTGNRATCQKCHTSTGAENYLKNPATYVAANNTFSHLKDWTAATGSPQNEALYCWGCHSNAGDGTLHAPGAITADYKFQGATATFPNVGASNVCIACHDGQASGNGITDLTADAKDFTNVSFVNSHYMAAAGLMYVKIGYTNFVPAQTAIAGATGTAAISYGQSLTSDADMTVDKNNVAAAGKVSSTHRKLGTSAIIGDHGITAAMGLDKNGPCVACHYAKGSHSLEMGDVAYNEVCIKCHTAEGLTAIDASNYKEHFVEPQGEVFQDALSLALKVLKDNYNISYNQAAYPYFYDDNLAAGSAVKDWTRATFRTSQGKAALSAADAEKLMGACFNINLLKRDPAAYAHARTYTRRLVYDTIDFLDDITINQSVGTTALASGMTRNAAPIFTKGTKAFNSALSGTSYAVTDVAEGTSEAMTYLLGWARSGATTDIAGAWNAWERP